ncbi:MAG TPA: class I SAM-dependent methyltransferase [Candidatus Acidoferrum sp.]|jgi:ubiquinone/menaquinone biosynthesis C-methylase UbiE
MNTLEHCLCSSSLWRYISQRQLLPWVLSDACLGDHVLEIGAGYGAATVHLRERVPRITSLEYDHNSTRKLKAHHNDHSGGVLRGDASHLPFASESFSSAIAILVLHHLKSRNLQDLAFAEVLRVLRPGGTFLAFEINDSWIHHLGHFKSTFTPLPPGSAFARLTRAGFSRVSVDFRRGGFRLHALRAKREHGSREPKLPPQNAVAARV